MVRQPVESIELQKAAAEGRLKRGAIWRLFAERGIPFTTIPLDEHDIVRAQAQAQKRGISYQSYLQMIVHDALERADQKQGQESAAS